MPTAELTQGQIVLSFGVAGESEGSYRRIHNQYDAPSEILSSGCMSELSGSYLEPAYSDNVLVSFSMDP